jgi:hypothetical protein
VHHYAIQTNLPTRSNSFTSLLLDVYAWLNMFRALPRPSSGAYSLWFYRWSVAIAVLLVVVCQTTTNNAAVATLDVCVAQHVSGASSPIIRNLQLH